MKTFLLVVGAACAWLALLTSCGQCSCRGSGSSDYLRDIPVLQSHSFD